MSLPVPYLPGETRHDIRNTRESEYLFAPTPLIRHAFTFIVAALAERYRVGIVAYAMMCTHIHILIVDLGDPDQPSDVPRFRSVLRSTFAQFIKWYWGRENGRIFCPDSIGKSISVLDFDSIEKAIAYIESNPMEAGMEKSPEQMKGAVSLRKWLLEPLVVSRPDVYFQKRTWVETAELKLVVPPEAEKMGHTPESFYKTTKSALDDRLASIAKTRRKEKKKARPLHVLERLRPEHGTRRVGADHTEVLLNCADPIRAAIEFQRIRSFRAQHARALQRRRDGEVDVLFPPGTYKAARVYGVKVREPDPNQRLE